MKHYLITFRNGKVSDMKLVAKDYKEAKKSALFVAKYVHPKTHIMIKDIWECTKVFS